MDNEIKITTRHNADRIEQSERWPGDDPRDEVMKRVINLREEGVRRALIELGWLPPPLPLNANLGVALKRIFNALAGEDERQRGIARDRLLLHRADVAVVMEDWRRKTKRRRAARTARQGGQEWISDSGIE